MKLFVTLLAVVAAVQAAPRPEKLDDLVVQDQQPYHPDRDARILDQLNQHQEDGGYQQSFRTENGIAASEQGISYPGAEPESGSYVKEGSYEYQADDGSVFVVNYVADENGYEVLNPEVLAVALPTPPPTEYPPPLVPGAGLAVPEPLPEYNSRTTFAL